MRTRAFLLSLIILAAFVAPAEAQVTRWGIRAGAFFDPTDPFVGVEALIPLAGDNFFFNPNVEHIFGDRSVTLINGDVHYDFDTGSRDFFWVGAGIAGILGDGDSDVGVNFLAGYGVSRGDLTPYVQVKALVADDDTTMSVGGGVRF